MEEYADFVRTDEVIEQSFPFNLNKDSILFARVEEPYEDTEVYDDSFEYTDDYSVSYSADSYFTLDNYDEFFGLLKQDIKARSDTDALCRLQVISICMINILKMSSIFIFIILMKILLPNLPKNQKYDSVTGRNLYV